MDSSVMQQRDAIAAAQLTASNPYVSGSAANPKITYESQVINSVTYVTAAQAQQMSDQAAARGAQLGEAKTLRSLRNKPAVRKRSGVK